MYGKGDGRFRQVRSQKGGGTKQLHIPLAATYTEVLMLAQSLFFPNGESYAHGSVNQLAHCLGSFDGTKIDEAEFSSLGTFIQNSGIGSHMRIYLMSNHLDLVQWPS